jgi:2-haloacid dehalogenase
VTDRHAIKRPQLLVFDVNETLIDLDHLTPLFARVFGDGGVMRDWFAQVILYSQSLTLAGGYTPFGEIAAAVLEMLGAIKGTHVTPHDVTELRERLVTLPPHPDVSPALDRLREAGFRLATLTNSPPRLDGGPLRRAGLESYFERCFGVDEVRRFKPAPETYRFVCKTLAVAPEDMCLVAAHMWDTLGAQSFGATGALILRPGNADLPLDGAPRPTFIAKDLVDLAGQLVAIS